MRQITKDIEINIDGSPVSFRLFKTDAFSGVTLMWVKNENQARAAEARA